MTGSTAPPAPDLVVMPRKVRRIVIPIAVVLVVVFVIVALLLRSGSTGVQFGPSDQVSLVLIGLALAGGTLLFARPRVRADADGVEVRNLLFGQRVPWTLVRAVSFPDGAPWARLELPEDEYVPVVAIQAADGALAVSAVRELRALHRAAEARLAAGEADRSANTADRAGYETEQAVEAARPAAKGAADASRELVDIPKDVPETPKDPS